jgi:Flp pilus assembly protein TadG
MLFRPLRSQRRGTVLAETAIVFSVVVALTVGMVVVGLGIFSYQQTSCMAREGARWLSVRGSQYNSDTSNTGTMSNLKSYLRGMGQVDQVAVWYGVPGNWTQWDGTSSIPITTTVGTGTEQTWIKVKVTCNWTAYLGNITMGSTAQVPMAN